MAKPACESGGYYGLGYERQLGDWDWFGHSGGPAGLHYPHVGAAAQALSVSVLTNAIDGWADPWVDGAVHILRGSRRTARQRKTLPIGQRPLVVALGRHRSGRHGRKVLAARPASPIRSSAPARSRSPAATTADCVAGGYASHGEPVRWVRRKSGQIAEIWLAGTKLVPAPELARELQARYGECVATEAAPSRASYPRPGGRQTQNSWKSFRTCGSRRDTLIALITKVSLQGVAGGRVAGMKSSTPIANCFQTDKVWSIVAVLMCSRAMCSDRFAPTRICSDKGSASYG